MYNFNKLLCDIYRIFQDECFSKVFKIFSKILEIKISSKMLCENKAGGKGDLGGCGDPSLRK